MTPGSHAEVFELGPAKAMMSICYEAIHPEFTRQAALSGGGNMILNLTNDGWFGDYGAPGQHLMVQAPRAVELRTSLVRVTQTGITAVISPSGNMLDGTTKALLMCLGPKFLWSFSPCVAVYLLSMALRYTRKRRRGWRR